jgi:CubicO group peptidase (beta-lactamase class C family)
VTASATFKPPPDQPSPTSAHISTQTQRKQQERSACRAGKPRHRLSMTSSLGPIRSTSGAHEADAPTEERKGLDRRVPSDQYVIKAQATWGMSAKRSYKTMKVRTNFLNISLFFTAFSLVFGHCQAANFDKIYRGDDGSAIYIHQVDDKLYGFGEHPGEDYSFVFEGDISGTNINGNWWDVPKFSRTKKGALDLQWSQGGNRIVRKGGGNFGTNTWTALQQGSNIPWISEKKAGFQSTKRKDLDGHFKGDDGSSHYIREVDSKVVWVAEKGAVEGARPKWTTVFIGERTNNSGISGKFSDVSKGSNTKKSGNFGAAQIRVSGSTLRELSVSQIGITRTRKLLPEYNIDFDAFSERIFNAFNNNVVGFAYAITKNDRIVREDAGGVRRRQPDGSELPFTVRTQNESASTTKLVTAAVVIRTLEEKDIPIDITVARYFPDCWEKGSRIDNRRYGLTLKQLLSHKSGITRPASCSNNPYRCLKESVAVGVQNPRTRDYQNINFTIFRYILPSIRNATVADKLCVPTALESAANADVSERYARHVRDQVFAPMDINTGFEWTAPKFALRYDFSSPSAPGLRTDTTDDYLETGSGGMKWSAHEYGKFLAALTTEKIVSAEGLRVMKSELLGFDSEMDRPAGRYYFKNGGATGTQSQLVIFPSGITAYVTINSSNNGYSSNGRAWILWDAFEKSIR